MKIFIKTIGCKTNYADSTSMASTLVARGATLVESPMRADVLILNSCVVTHRAESDVRKELRRLRRSNPGGFIVLVGCGASLDGGRNFSGLADVVMRTDPEAVAGLLGLDGIGDEKPNLVGGRARKYVKVQDGCDKRCSYCIVPVVRGRSRSREESEILNEVVNLERAGVAEVVLTGVHLGHYGMDKGGKGRLFELLSKLLDATEKVRFRLSSLEVDEIDDELLKLMAEETRLCRHLHIPLQSGDDGVLKAMGRWYSTAEYREAVCRIKSAVPDICVGTDVITGFPGEDDESFMRTRRFLEETPVDYLHVFSFSRREGTKAAKMPNQVPENTKKERTRILRELGDSKRRRFIGKFIGREFYLVCERAGSSEFEGTTDNYIRVTACGNACVGKLVKVRIEEATRAGARGIRV